LLRRARRGPRRSGERGRSRARRLGRRRRRALRSVPAPRSGSSRSPKGCPRPTGCEPRRPRCRSAQRAPARASPARASPARARPARASPARASRGSRPWTQREARAARRCSAEGGGAWGGGSTGAGAGGGAGTACAVTAGTAGPLGLICASHAGVASKIGVCSPMTKKSVLVVSGSKRMRGGAGGRARERRRGRAVVRERRARERSRRGGGGEEAWASAPRRAKGSAGAAAGPGIEGGGGGTAAGELGSGGGARRGCDRGESIDCRAIIIVSFCSSSSSSSWTIEGTSGRERGRGARSPPTATSRRFMSSQPSGCRTLVNATSTRPASSGCASVKCARQVTVQRARSVSIHRLSGRSSSSWAWPPPRSTKACGRRPGQARGEARVIGVQVLQHQRLIVAQRGGLLIGGGCVEEEGIEILGQGLGRRPPARRALEPRAALRPVRRDRPEADRRDEIVAECAPARGWASDHPRLRIPEGLLVPGPPAARSQRSAMLGEGHRIAARLRRAIAVHRHRFVDRARDQAGRPASARWPSAARRRGPRG
jgi:hypothetical protein